MPIPFRYTRTLVASIVISLAAVASMQAGPPSPEIQRLSGVWNADVYRVRLSTDLDAQVWGPNASRVRKVNLTLEPSGQGIVTIYTSVENAKGRTVAYSASVIEAHVTVEPPDQATSNELVVNIRTAEERYLDNSGDRRNLENIQISLHTVADDANVINLRYDTPQGTGSFGETLHRRTPRRSQG